MTTESSLLKRSPRLLLSVAFFSILATRPAVSEEATAPELESQILRWDETKLHSAPWGEMHRYFTGRTSATEDVYVAVAVVQPGKAVHHAHRHAAEEYLAVIDGTGVWSLDGKESPAKKGDILYVKPWVYHGLTNTGDTPLVFLVIKYNGRGVEPPPRPDDRPDELEGQADADLPREAQAAELSGTVTFDGQPVPGARVIFQPVDGGRPFSTVTNENGQYKLIPSEQVDGPKPGQYRVTIEKTPDKDDSSKAAGRELPAKYSNPAATGLVAEIEEGVNVLNFELASN